MPLSSSEHAAAPLLHRINALRAVPLLPWRTAVRRVAVILSSSRAGSSLLKSVLAAHPDIAALGGEAEPYLALSGNGFGWNSDSDALSRLERPEQLASDICDGMGLASTALPAPAVLRARWERRLLLQFPAEYSQPAALARLRRDLAELLDGAARQATPDNAAQLQAALLRALHRQAPWRLDYYDGQLGPGNAPAFEGDKIEEPPFVLPSLYRRPLQLDEAGQRCLLFKTPSDAYRPGFYEQLFPRAEVRYLHLTRGFAASVNGLIDGWLSPHGFFAHDMAQQRQGRPLAIAGYSEQRPFGARWWKFDLPPNWRDFTGAPLEQVCLNQWYSCQHAILAARRPALRLAFEDFLQAPDPALQRICAWLGLAPLPPCRRLPVVMATAAPAPRRWRQRSAVLLALARRPEVAALMTELGYRMDPETWQ